jgi:uncharacterized RDD family membrane protein YckC
MTPSRSGTVVIRTPEGVEFSLPLAGPFSRMLAFSIDLCVIGAVTQVLLKVLAPLAAFGEDALQAVSIIGYFVISLAYGSTTEWMWQGRTVGKRLLNLRVVEAQGLRLKPAQVIIRNLMRFADALPAFYLVGAVACVLSPRRQRLGDLVAGTIVIRTTAAPLPRLDQFLGQKFNSLAEEKHLAARLRQQVSPELARLACDSMLRRNELEPAARLKLLRDLAGHFRALVPYPAEVTDQLSDEQYVRDVVEILFTRRNIGPQASGSALTIP